MEERKKERKKERRALRVTYLDFCPKAGAHSRRCCASITEMKTFAVIRHL